MDHSISTQSITRRSSLDQTSTETAGKLHRGALQEIRVDRLVNKAHLPQHLFPEKRRYRSETPDGKGRRKIRKHRLANEDIFFDSLMGEFGPTSQTSPLLPNPNALRRRSASTDISSRKRSPRKESQTIEERILSMPPSEAFALKTDLRQRRKMAPTHTNNDVPAREREALMDSIRRSGHRNRRPPSRWVIPMDHPLKNAWDILTVILSIANAYFLHVSIRERTFDASPFMLFCDVWFFLDILSNFVTERKTPDGETLRDYRSICARYLTSWFAVDALALIPWESLYVKPIIDLQKRRGFFKKSFFRSRAVVRVSRHLRGRHFRWFGRVARHTKQHGVGANRLLRLIIKYVPKYVLFLKNMKGAVAVRFLRQFHWCRRFYNNIVVSDEKSEGLTGSITRDDSFDDLSSAHSERRGGGHVGQPRQTKPEVRVVYETWELMSDDDLGVPL